MYTSFLLYCFHDAGSSYKDYSLIVRIIVTMVMVLLAISIFPLVLYMRYRIMNQEKEKTREYYEEDLILSSF